MTLKLAITPEELGRRIAEARKSRSVSQDDAARHIGVSRPTFIAIEKGTRQAKPEEIIKLAELFRRPVHDLVSQTAFVSDFMPQFRMTENADISEESLSDAVNEFQSVCEDYLGLEKLFNEPQTRIQQPEVYSIERLSVAAAAEDVAQQERSRLNLGQGSIVNLLDVLETDVGLRVFVLPIKEFRIAGMFYYTERLGGCVLINGTHPMTRQRWSLAHEYAHYLVDRYRQDVTVFVEYARKPRSEQFADEFAASFLMPAAGLQQRFRRIVQSRADFKVADLCLLADQYGVSVEAMTRRLESLQCVRRGMWDALKEQVTLSKVRKHLRIRGYDRERLRLPERYRRLAVEAFNEEMIGESQLMHLLRCSRVEVREIVEELTQTEEIEPSGNWYQLNLNFADPVPIDAAERS